MWRISRGFEARKRGGGGVKASNSCRNLVPEPGSPVATLIGTREPLKYERGVLYATNLHDRYIAAS